jgi:hypothetical protein
MSKGYFGEEVRLLTGNEDKAKGQGTGGQGKGGPARPRRPTGRVVGGGPAEPDPPDADGLRQHGSAFGAAIAARLKPCPFKTVHCETAEAVS